MNRLTELNSKNFLNSVNSDSDNDNKPRKTLAQHWLQTLGATIVPTLHQKTNYQATPSTDRETQLEQQLIESQKENARLQQLVKNNEVKGNIKWNLLSHDPERIRYALSQSPLPEDLERYFLI